MITTSTSTRDNVYITHLMDFPLVEHSELDGKEAPSGSLKIA